MILPTITVQPTIEPVTLDEAKLFCRVDYGDDDSLLESLIAAARKKAEGWLGRALITQTRQLKLADNGFVAGGNIILPNPNVQSISGITYYDTSDILQTASTSLYRLQNASDPSNEAFVELIVNQTWPTASTDRANPWTLTYVCGYGDTADLVPEEIRLGIKIMVATWYEHRESVVVGTITNDMPFSITGVMMAHRWHWTV